MGGGGGGGRFSTLQTVFSLREIEIYVENSHFFLNYMKFLTIKNCDKIFLKIFLRLKNC